MSDDKFEDEDFLDDDLDFEEFEDLDDTSGDWDELEEEVESSDADVSALTPSSQKTFLQKYFNFIVIGIIAVGAGLFGWAQFGGTPAQPLKQETPETAVVEAPLEEVEAALTDVPELEEGMPPMPVPMDANIEEANVLSEIPNELPAIEEEVALRSNADLQDAGVLTPMPDIQAIDDAMKAPTETSLPDLDLKMDSESTIQETQTDIEQAFLEADMQETVPASESSTLEEKITEIPAADIQPKMETMTPKEESADLTPEQFSMPEEPALTIDSEPVQAAVTDVSAYEVEIQEKDKKIQGLEGKVNESEEKISELMMTIQDLENQVLKLAEDAKEKERIAEATVSKPAAQAVKAPSVKKPSKKPQPTVKKAKKHAVSWSLRSAQPGKAVLASKRTGDLRTVEIGDTVPGIGRVSNISIENGKWVVRGKIGKISQ